MLDLLYVAKLDFLAGIGRSFDDPHECNTRFVPVDGRQQTAERRKERSDRKASGKSRPQSVGHGQK
jgi:hypothetical protein